MTNIDLTNLEKKYQSSRTVDEQFEFCEQYRTYLEDQLKKNPCNVQALIHFGVLSWEPFHDYEKAVASLKKAIEIDSQNVDARFWLATCYYHDYCEYEKAKHMALEALTLDPTRADCLCLLAVISWHYYHNLQDAIQYLEKAIYYAPDWPTLRHLLVSLLLEIKDIKSAEFQLSQALKLAQSAPAKPRNGIEEYYESIVTGRGWTDKKERFQKLIERIQREKAFN